MSDDEALRAVYARIMRQRDASGRSGAVPVEQMQAVLERSGSQEERVRTLDAIMRDQDSRADFEILRAAYDAAPARSTSFPMSYAIAAALIVMVGSGLWLRSRTPPGPDDVPRGAPPSVTIIAPGALVQTGAPVSFTWRRRPDAKVYSLQLMDADGAPVFSIITSDTTVALPDSVRLSPAKDYRWWVEAERSTASPVKSDVQRLRVRDR